MSADLEFIDTNVLLYAFDTSDPSKHAVAKTLLGRLWASQTGCLSVQVMQEFFVNATRKLGLPITQARAVLEDYRVWIVHAPNSSDVIAATALMDTVSLSFWDAMMVMSASELGCRTIWTEDLNAGQVIAGAQIRNPFALPTRKTK
jgi:predicted nucleic acid-binding protein